MHAPMQTVKKLPDYTEEGLRMEIMKIGVNIAYLVRINIVLTLGKNPNKTLQ